MSDRQLLLRRWLGPRGLSGPDLVVVASPRKPVKKLQGCLWMAGLLHGVYPSVAASNTSRPGCMSCRWGSIPPAIHSTYKAPTLSFGARWGLNCVRQFSVPSSTSTSRPRLSPSTSLPHFPLGPRSLLQLTDTPPVIVMGILLEPQSSTSLPRTLSTSETTETPVCHQRIRSLMPF